MSDFKAKMNQIRFPLGLRPRRARPRWGSLQRSPRPIAVFKLRGLLLRGRRGKGEGKGRRGKGKGEGRVGPLIGESGSASGGKSGKNSLERDR